MPVSDTATATIDARYHSYNEDFRRAVYPSPEELVREVDISKSFLRTIPGNRITEHNILCMWRVILLDDYCIVQNYFPQTPGGHRHSDDAPVFVFEKSTECSFSYYKSFETMFDLIKTYTNLHPPIEAPGG